MKRRLVLAIATLAVAFAAPALAGSGAAAKAGKCTQDTQACLNQFANYQSKGWLGLDLDKSSGKGLVVKKIAAGSPAEPAGFQAGDLLVSLNGVAMNAEKEEMKKAKGEWAVGQTVTYVVLREGKEVKLEAKLAAMPPEVFARMVGDHMVTDHMTAASAAAVK